MLSPEGTPVNSPMGTPTRGKKEIQKSFFERVVENPVFVVDELLSKVINTPLPLQSPSPFYVH